jgi:hypothetical protein
MFRKSLPIGTLVMILILALAAIGVGYGLWAERLQIFGRVVTGEVDVFLSGPAMSEWVDIRGEPNPEPPEKDPYTVCEGRAYQVSQDDPYDDGPDTIEILVSGAYPSYHCEAFFDVYNIGSVPVKVSAPVQVAGPDWVALKECYEPWTQIEPNEYVLCKVHIHFTNTDDVDENTEYRFQFLIDALQWNEAP